MRTIVHPRWWLIGVCLWVATRDCAAGVVEPPPNAGRKVDFDREIQPLFRERCIKCHGAGEKSGGLSLAERAGALAELDSGSRAVVPGDTGASEILRRVAAADPSERMPPKGEPLSTAEIQRLTAWIEAGADWPEHWAYRPLLRPTVPEPTVPSSEATLPSTESAGTHRTAIDRFILARLLEQGLAMSPPADKRTLLRRLSFDLIGLPPTPEEMDAFLQDDSTEAYERVVERLLASPHYGERWARHWMDVAHYAETHGHDQDRPRPNAWPYRDYLVRSFNQDKPYARFVQEQLAGDVLFAGDAEALVAMGFLATGPWDESSLRDIREDSIDREIGRYLDRDDIVTTAMNTFVSTTVQCARCHNHKFDPVSQADYYGLQAVFAGVDKAERAYDPDPAVAGRRGELLARLAQLPALRQAADPSLLEPGLLAETAQWEQSVAASALTWTVLDATATSSGGATLTKQPDGSFLAGGTRPETDTYTIVASTDLPHITGLRLELLTDESLPHGGPGRQDNGNLHLNEFQVMAAPAKEPSAVKPVGLANPRADFNQEGWTVAMALDGNPGTAWGVYPEVGKPHAAVFEFAQPLSFEGGTTLTFRLEQTHGGGHLIGRPRLAVTSAALPLPVQTETLPAEIVRILATPAAQRTDRDRAELAGHVLGQRLARDLAALPPPQMVYSATSEFKPDGSFRPAMGPRPIFVLARGDIHNPGPAAVPGALSCLPGLERHFQPGPGYDAAHEGSRRAALAAWTADAANGLTWRSIVNRVWHYHFGRGLVDTPNDFGRMGATPSHPQLLDWLASEFRDGGGSFKRLHRLIVISEVYRQSSAYDARSAGIDADNRLLWRMNRSRLDAESVRDCMLRISGTLDCTMGGPSVKQFIQTPGIHVTPNVDYTGFDVDSPASFRRSVYRFIFRTLPDPFMDSLDCADSSQLTPARNTSVTALQALTMLNDKFVVRQSEHLAERVAAAAPDLPGQIGALYRLALNRDPSDRERAALADFATRYGLANACRLLLNSNEFMFVN